MVAPAAFFKGPQRKPRGVKPKVTDSQLLERYRIHGSLAETAREAGYSDPNWISRRLRAIILAGFQQLFEWESIPQEYWYRPDMVVQNYLAGRLVRYAQARWNVTPVIKGGDYVEDAVQAVLDRMRAAGAAQEQINAVAIGGQ